MVLRTGCSASLYGLHLACQSLQSGDISSALVGGVNLIMNPASEFLLTYLLSPCLPLAGDPGKRELRIVRHLLH